MGHFVLTELHDELLLQLLVSAIGIAVMLGTGPLLEWYRNGDREVSGRTARPVLPREQTMATE